MLNGEQQAIVKDIRIRKKRNLNEPTYLFITGGAGVGKMLTTKEFFQMLIRICDS